MKTPGHRKGTPFADGPLIAKAADLGTFALFWENAGRLRKLNKRLKLFRGEDGWFATGRQGQLWEWGVAMLGFTVGTTQMISKAIAAGFVATQCGDGEANFSHSWTDESVERLIGLLKLRTRRASIPVRTRSTEHLFKVKPHVSPESGVTAQTGPAEEQEAAK